MFSTLMVIVQTKFNHTDFKSLVKFFTIFWCLLICYGKCNSYGRDLILFHTYVRMFMRLTYALFTDFIDQLTNLYILVVVWLIMKYVMFC